MSDITREQIDAMIDVLRNFPADGQMRGVDRDLATTLILYGFVVREEVEKPCPTCGKPSHDYGYFRITPAGRAILAFAESPPHHPDEGVQS